MLGYKMAVRAVEDGIRIRRKSWEEGQWFVWSDAQKCFFTDSGDHVMQTAAIRLYEDDWEEYKEPKRWIKEWVNDSPYIVLSPNERFDVGSYKIENLSPCRKFRFTVEELR